MTAEEDLYAPIRRRNPTDRVMERGDFLAPGSTYYMRIEGDDIIIVEKPEDSQFKIYVGEACNPVYRDDVFDLHRSMPD